MGALFDEEVSSRAFRTADEEIMKTIHWSLALQWAQETLLCRDIFSLLTKQAVEMEDRFAVLKNGVLVVALHGEYLLKIRLTYHPFTDGEIPQKGVVYLGRCLRQMFVSDQSTRWIKHRVFTTMPLTDAPKSLHMSGLKAIPAEQVEQLSKGEKPLLTRTIQVASHFILVKKATAILDQIAARCEDPQIVWRWVRSSRMQSCAAVVISTRNYDNIGRLSFHVRITTERISIFTREAQIIDCARDE
uniref:Uncharacterized protein n=1 Tax=Plectus sambesii TaxID=2011161 RepID=A0A914UJC0_9BILA